MIEKRLEVKRCYLGREASVVQGLGLLVQGTWSPVQNGLQFQSENKQKSGKKILSFNSEVKCAAKAWFMRLGVLKPCSFGKVL